MAQGFVSNDTAVAGITTAFAAAQAVALTATSALDVKAKPLPQACYLSHLELKLAVTGGVPTTIQALLCWDSAGDEVLAGPTLAITPASGVTTTTNRILSIQVDCWPTAPTPQTSLNKVYLFLRTDAGTVTCTRARLYWVDRNNR